MNEVLRLGILLFAAGQRESGVVARFVRMAAPRQDSDSTVEKIRFERYVFS
jgi:hypothetical protein